MRNGKTWARYVWIRLSSRSCVSCGSSRLASTWPHKLTGASRVAAVEELVGPSEDDAGVTPDTDVSDVSNCDPEYDGGDSSRARALLCSLSPPRETREDRE